MTAAKILAVDDEPDFEILLTQRFRRQIRAQEFAFRFAHHGEEALAVLDSRDVGIRNPATRNFALGKATREPQPSDPRTDGLL